ncbi:MAG: hypothetical protein CMI96_01405 [Pelagibacteraceae bacterium]|nr:hypothetical protein [Pelagibacteraceae bacterium]|tara:strand:+ start:10710 stop:11777 length:1068 start_codon:yes stop_codon:yes gene_type:complete
MKCLIKIIFLLILLNNKIYAQDIIENKIIFKINNLTFTSVDLEKRKDYLSLINEVDYSYKEITDDLISATIFYEYYKEHTKASTRLEKDALEIYNNILGQETINDNKKESILLNIKYDLIRKNTLENLLTVKKDQILEKPAEIDLIYDIKIYYISISYSDYENIKNEISFKSKNDFKYLENYLKSNEINYYYKVENIQNINDLDKNIYNNIKSNNQIFILNNNNFTSYVYIEKKLESYEGVTAKLISVKTENKIIDIPLNCKNINKFKSLNITENSYKYIDLNDKIKENLKQINDVIMIKDNKNFNYIFLCEMTFNQEILNEINVNKKIKSFIIEIEKNFIKKYSELYNLIKFDE